MKHSPQLTFLSNMVLFASCLLRSAAGDETPSWTFETDESGWTARAATVTVARKAGVGATDNSHACLHISGSIDTGWNYALSKPAVASAGQLVRLTAWVRVDRLGASTPSPYLKCEFTRSDSRASLGQVHTDAYQRNSLGQWQQLSMEFSVPNSADRIWLALEKGTNGLADIDAFVDEIELQPIKQLSVITQYRLDPIPNSLQAMRGVHPRLFVTPQRVVELRAAVKTTHKEIWNEVHELADRYAKRPPPRYRADDNWSGDEQLWQREVGNTMPMLAMAYLITEDQKYLDAARAWALASCQYETWGLGKIDGMDLATGHQLLGLALVYDWCYDALNEETRATIRGTLTARTSTMFTAAATNKAWWRRSYMQNHLWVNACGIAAVGFALFDEKEDALMWIGMADTKFRLTMAALGSDGASHEGVGYWEYGVEYLLKYMELARTLLDEDLYQAAWWKQTPLYALHLSLPRNSWTRQNCIVDIADCPRSHWYGPDYQLRGLASHFRDEHAQWLADEVDRANVSAPNSPWLNLLWYDPAVASVPPTTLATCQHFEDMGIVASRSDWSGDESLVVFKCGPPLGHEAVSRFDYDPGGGHVHPDANHFVIFGNGEWLIRDDGYQSKWTSQHNTLLVDGAGQLGETQQWFDTSKTFRSDTQATVRTVKSGPIADYFSGDASGAYPSEIGLTRFERHLLFVKPDVLIVIDDIALKAPRQLELRIHPEHRKYRADESGFLFEGDKTLLRLEPIGSDAAQAKVEDTGATGRHGDELIMLAFRMTRSTDRWRNALAISWSDKAYPPTRVQMTESGERWTFAVEQQQWEFDWSTCTFSQIETK